MNRDIKNMSQKSSQVTKRSKTNLSLEQKEINYFPQFLPDDDDPLCYFKSSSFEKNSFPCTLQVSYCSYELFPESENVFLSIFKLGTNTVDQSSNGHKVQVSPLSFKPISPVQWTKPDFEQSENHHHLINFPTVTTEVDVSMCLRDLDFDKTGKIPVKSENSLEILEKSVTSTVDHQVNSPMFSEAGSPEHWTASGVDLSKNIERLVDFVTKTAKAGCPLPSTHPSTNQTKNLHQSISLPTMTTQAHSPVDLIKQNVNKEENFRPNMKTLLYKTELCRNFLEGNCRLGMACNFAHGLDDLRPVSRHPMYKTKICKFYLKLGYCPYGNRCVFVHPADTASSQPYNLGSDGETSPHSSYSCSPPGRKSFDFDDL